jgi:NAD(P)-dependent dehydrogenase (short-subunit alcohol dehydrogenase family)
MFKDGLFKDRVILITGGGTGLGKSMARRFSELGASVAIVSRKMDVLQQTAQEISQVTGQPVLALEHDVRKYQNLSALLDAILTRFGRIDALVNNAAGNFISPTERLSYKVFDIIVDIVLRGSYYMTLALGKYWIVNKLPGNVLSIVTTYASTGSGYVTPSAVAKAGVLNLTRSLAAEWGKYNIRLNAIAPGPFPTKGAWQRLFPKPDMEQTLINRIPLKRAGEHSELANLAAYLLSDYSGYITGEVVTIDGGEWLAGAGEFNFLEALPPEDWDRLEEERNR